MKHFTDGRVVFILNNANPPSEGTHSNVMKLLDERLRKKIKKKSNAGRHGTSFSHKMHILFTLMEQTESIAAELTSVWNI